MTSRPLVVLDALLVGPEPTGVGRSILELTSALSRSDRGFAFVVLATHPEMFTFLDGIRHWRVVECPQATGGVLRKAVFTQVRLPSLVRRLGGQLLHCLQFVGPLRSPCPVVATVHDLGYLRYPATIQRLRRVYYRFLVPRTLNGARKILTNSAATAAEVVEYFPAVTGRVAVTPFGTPSWALDRSRLEPTTRAQDPNGNDPPFLVGTLEPRKNLKLLLQAYRDFLDHYEEFAGRFGPGGGGGRAQPPDLLLVGARGWHDSELRAVVGELQDRGKLRLQGYCPADRLWKIYRSARALLFPSLHEGFGFPILEAMAAGLPVLTSDRGAMREVAGQAALLVEPQKRDALARGIAQIHFQPELRQRLIDRGQQRVKAWNWDRTAASTVAAYQNILGCPV